MHRPHPFHNSKADDPVGTGRRNRLVDAARDRRGRHSPIRLGGLSDLFATLGSGGARPALA